MLSTPTPELVARCVREFNSKPRYADADRTVRKVFEQWPGNVNIDEVLAKVVILNRLYSTNIYDTYAAATNIVERGIDVRLQCGDLGIVEEVADMRFANDKRRFNLSFASKYCSWHQRDHYQIYDSYAADLLWAYRAQDNFATFKRTELRIYTRYMQIVDRFREFYGLADTRRKDLDHFLWIARRDQLAGPAAT